MRVVVCGGRKFRDEAFVFAALDKISSQFDFIDKVIEGGAGGLDALAKRWAKDRGREHHQEPAHWEDLGAPGAVIDRRADGTRFNVLAGFQRNQRMADMKPDFCVAFPGGRGTEDMMRRARCAGVPVIKVKQSAGAGSPAEFEVIGAQ